MIDAIEIANPNAYSISCQGPFALPPAQCYRMINLRHLRIILGDFFYFDDFRPPIWLNWQIMAYEILKNRQTAKMAVFRRFLCGFGWFWAVFHNFSNSFPPNLLIWLIMDYEILKCHQTNKLTVFWWFLCGFL